MQREDYLCHLPHPDVACQEMDATLKQVCTAISKGKLFNMIQKYGFGNMPTRQRFARAKTDIKYGFDDRPTRQGFLRAKTDIKYGDLSFHSRCRPMLMRSFIKS
jgi:hypothetical protein